MAEVSIEEVPKSVRDMFNKGFAAFERGNLDYAIDMLFHCIEAEPRFLRARRFLRAAEIKKFKQKKSNVLTQAFSAVSGMPKLMKKAKTPEEAVLITEKLLKSDPLNERFVKAFAHAAKEADIPEAAIFTLEAMRDHEPDNMDIVELLGKIYIESGNTKDARECFEKLTAARPNDPEALRALKNVEALHSMNRDGWVQASEEGGSYRDIIKDTEEATLLEQQSKAVKTDKDADHLIQQALEKIETEPENINYYRAAAKLYAQKHMYAEAADLLSKAMEMSPGDPELDKTLTSVYTQHYDHQVGVLRESGDEEAAAKMEQERNQFVFDNLQERVGRYPNDMVLRYDFGVMLFDNGYLNEAIQQFQLSQRSPKHRVRSLYYMAMCFRQKGQLDLAVHQLEDAAKEIIQMDGTKKDILYQIGEIAEDMGDTEKAAEFYKKIYSVDIGYRDIAQKIENVYKTGEES